MEWSPEQVQTVGQVFAALIAAFGLIIVGVFRVVGQRTDPKLMELYKLQQESNDKQAETRSKDYERLANALDRNTDTLQTVESGLEAMFRGWTTAIKEMIGSIAKEHASQLTATQSIIPAIKEEFNVLKTQLSETEKSNKGITQVVEGMGKTHSNGINQLIEIVLRVEKRLEDVVESLETLQGENREQEKRNREREKAIKDELEKTTQDMNVIRGDVLKLKKPPQPTPDNQPIVMPKATVAPKAEPKPETKTDEKDAKNGV
jgi:myosin heavy subunit